MDTILVNKAALLEVMQKNREEHHDIVVEAQSGFRAKVIERLDEMLKLAAKGDKIQLAVGLTMPEDHTAEYDTIIGMLKMSVEEEIELDQHQYTSWVEDNWGWQRSFTTSNAYYSVKAAAKNL